MKKILYVFYSKIFKTDLFKTFLFSYVLILLVPIITGIIIYFSTFQTLSDDIVKSNKAILNQSISMLDKQFKETNQLAYKIADNPIINQLSYIKDPFSSKNINYVREATQALQYYNTTNDFITAAYIFYQNNHTVISKNYSALDKDFYKYKFNYYNINYEEWRGELFQQYYVSKYLPTRKSTYNNEEFNTLTMLNSIGLPNANKTTIALYINQNTIKECFTHFNSFAGGEIFIINENDNIIFKSTATSNMDLDINTKNITDNVMSINGKKYIVTTVISSYNQFKYVFLQPYDIIMKQLEYIKTVSLVSLICFLIIGIILVYIMAYKNVKPFSDLIEKIENIRGRSNKSVHNTISDTIDQLVMDNETLNNKMQEQLPILKEVFLHNLLNGTYKDEYELSIYQQYSKISIPENNFIVFIINIYQYGDTLNQDILSESEKKRILVKEILINIITLNHFFVDIDAKNMAVILCYTDDIDIKNYISLIQQKYERQLDFMLGMQMQFAVGTPCNSLIELSVSTHNAQNVMDYCSWHNDEFIIWYDEINSLNNTYFSMPDIENRIVKAVKSGDKIATKNILKEFYTQNIINKNLSATFVRIFIYDLWRILVKLTDDLSLINSEFQQDILKEIENIPTRSDIENLSLCNDIYYNLSEYISMKKKSHNSTLIYDITNFVDQNYQNALLCLSMIADNFNISEAYLSQFFKEQLGENFSTYLENLRMEKAKQLLISTEYPINKIASSVGYNSSNTFCRAFKRNCGISASDYKKG